MSYGFIFCSLGAVLGTDPVDEYNSWQRYIDNTDMAVAAFFTLDAALKCVAHGRDLHASTSQLNLSRFCHKHTP